ncbi:MAG: hypothetical protein MRJ93_01620 [Nitrososphaeraceae archaeon]|nr:hypothetical protein [Nitrososphaeraceae archaeon]
MCIEPVQRSVLGINISEQRNMFVAENFIRSLVSKYGRHTVYTDGGTWYPQACNFLHLKHRLHSPLEKSLIERVLQYFKDRTECFDDCYPCIKKNSSRKCDLQHVYNWMKLFVYLYNSKVRNIILFKIGGEILLT